MESLQLKSPIRCRGITAKKEQCKIMIYAPDEETSYCKKHQQLFTPSQLNSFNEFRNSIVKGKKGWGRKKEEKKDIHTHQPETPVVNSFEKPEECPVCMESLCDQKEPLEPCGHWVHRDCQIKSGPTCVLCRTPINLSRCEKQKIDRMLRQRKRNEEKEDRKIAEQMQEFVAPSILVANSVPRQRVLNMLEFFQAPQREMELMQVAHLAAIEMAAYSGKENDPAFVASQMGIITSGIINRVRPWYNLTRVSLDEALRNGALSSII